MCTKDLLHKSQNAPVPYPTMHLCYKNVHVRLFLLQNCALWDMRLMPCGTVKLFCYLDMLHFYVLSIILMQVKTH